MTDQDRLARDLLMSWKWPGRDAILVPAVWAAPALALALGVHALLAGSVTEIGTFGLVSALHPGIYAALAILTASFLYCLFGPRPTPGVLLAAHVVVFAILLFGSASIIEPLPRTVTAWLHVGFADYIARTGQTLPNFDARFSWPGFFALVAMATRAAGMKNAMPLLAWTPVVLNLMYVGVVHRLARASSPDSRSAWLAAWLFLPANWVGQDYFGPQALNYLFYLLILMVLLVWFRRARSDREQISPAWASRAGQRLLQVARLPSEPFRHEPRAQPAGRDSRVALMATVLAIFIASTASHQLTPALTVLSVAALVLARRSTLRTLPILMGVIVAAYISYFTVAYWSGHLHDIFGSFGNISGTVSTAAVDRVQGNEGHQIVVLVRLLFAATVWALAAAGTWRLARRGRGDLGLLSLAGAPFLVLAAQSYGGEVLLRVYLFALPFMIMLITGLLAPVWPARRAALAAVMAGVVSLVLTGGFFVARFGNESFEQVRPADLQAVDWLYANASPGATFVAITSNVPWRAQAIERYDYLPLGQDIGPTAVPVIESRMSQDPHGAFLIMSQGQSVFAEAFLGEPPGWMDNIERQVVASGHFRLVYENEGARIYVLAGPSGAPNGLHP